MREDLLPGRCGHVLGKGHTSVLEHKFTYRSFWVESPVIQDKAEKNHPGKALLTSVDNTESNGPIVGLSKRQIFRSPSLLCSCC